MMKNKENLITADEAHKILREILPQLIIKFGLYEMFTKNPDKAIEKLKSILASTKGRYLSEKNIIIICDFPSERRKLLSFMRKNQNIDKDLKLMFLLQAVALFENMVNTHLQIELFLNYDFTIKEINNILYKLKMEDKLGWFLKIICGKDFTKSKKWKLIDDNLKARNFFIHYKPETGEKYDIYLKYLEIPSIEKFLEHSLYCYNYLKKVRSEKFKDFDRKIKTTIRILDERHEAIKKSSMLKVNKTEKQ